jgi:hypothetical protein
MLIPFHTPTVADQLPPPNRTSNIYTSCHHYKMGGGKGFKTHQFLSKFINSKNSNSESYLYTIVMSVFLMAEN